MKTQISIIKSIAIAMTLTALLVATSMQAAPQTEKSLYERLVLCTFIHRLERNGPAEEAKQQRITNSVRKSSSQYEWRTQTKFTSITGYRSRSGCHSSNYSDADEEGTRRT